MKTLQQIKNQRDVEKVINYIAKYCNPKNRISLLLVLYRASSDLERATFNALKDSPEEEE